MSETLPLVQELTDKGFGPLLERPLLGLAAVRGTMAVRTQDDLFPVDLDVRFLFGEDVVSVPDRISRQQQEHLGTDATLLGTLLMPSLAKVNSGDIEIGSEPALAELIAYYKGLHDTDETVPLTIIHAHGQSNGGRHEIQTSNGVIVDTETVLHGLRQRLQQTTNTKSGHPVLLIACNGRKDNPENLPASISAPGLHLLYYQGYVSLGGDQTPTFAN